MDRQAFDVVIPYKKGRSTEELRFCLRSVEKNLPFIGRVFIIGELPEWASDEIIHIPSEQRHEKSANVAVSHRISDDSTFEHVIMPILAKTFPTKSKYEL